MTPEKQISDAPLPHTAKDPTVPEGGTPSSADNVRLANIWIVLIAAFLIRLIYAWETKNVASLQNPIGDAAGYLSWAERIASGDWIGSESFYQAPLYPYVLGAWTAITGGSVGAIRILQACFGALSAGFLCVATSLLFGRRAGFLSGLLFACYGPAIFFDGIVQKASLGCVLICALLASLTWYAVSRKAMAVVVAGVVLGLLILTRENTIVWMPIVVAWIALTTWSTQSQGALRHVVVFAIGVSGVLLPVAYRNASIEGHWTLSTFQAGPNFYIGNHEGATGRYVPLVRGHETPAFERRDATKLAERSLGRPLSAQEVSDFWFSQSWDYIRSSPGSWVQLQLLKFAMIWNQYEVADAESAVVFEKQSWTLLILNRILHFGVLIPLAVVGLVVTAKHWRRLWLHYLLIASMVAAVVMFYVMGRYRYPLVPLLIPFASVGLLELWRSVFRRSEGMFDWARYPTGVYVVIVGLTAVAVNVPVHDEEKLDALAWMNAGVALAQQGRIPEATVYFDQAVEGHPTSAEANNNLAQALAIQGRFEEAIPHYKAALAADDTLLGVDFNLGVALEQVGQRAEAIEHYERALTVDPSDADARAAIARLREGPG